MPPKATFIQRLARRIENITRQSLTDGARRQIKRAILDRLGCALGARRLGVGGELVRMLRDRRGPPEASIRGVEGKISAEHAALANGAISSHLEYDSHDSIPAAIALAEALHRGGWELMTGLMAGYIVERAVNRLLASEVERRGLHWPAHLAAFPSTAACCKILGLDAERTADALSLAGCLSPVSPFEAFTMGASVKDLYSGWGNMLGVVAARLSTAGFSGPATLFEGERGIMRIWLGEPPSSEWLEEALPAEGDLGFPPTFKPYPCCTAAHPALTAVEQILSENPDLDPSRISSVKVGTYAFGASLSNASRPDTPISAKINIPYLIAAMLTHGRLLPEHTESPYLDDPRIRQLAGMVRVRALPGAASPLHRRRPAHVKIRLRDGVEIAASVEEARWARGDPATDMELREKLHALVGDLILTHRRDELCERIFSLEDIPDIREIIDLMLP